MSTLDRYQKCPYCEKKTCYLVIGYIGEPGGDEVRCYSCKRQWRTDWEHVTQQKPVFVVGFVNQIIEEKMEHESN